MKVIGYVHTPFVQKFGLPRQSGMADIAGVIRLEPPYNNPDAVRGLEMYSHIWVLWRFDGFDGDFAPTVRPPRMGGNRRLGVFATRSPHRPNPIGMSVVRLLQVECAGGEVLLHVCGVDMKDGTAVYDVKPYLPYADCVMDARDGFSALRQSDGLSVRFAEGVQVEADLAAMIVQLLQYDPRPSYQEDDRVYKMNYDGYEVHFWVQDGVAEVLRVVPPLN